MKGFVSKLTLLAMLLSSMFTSSTAPASAAGVTVSLSTPSSSSSPIATQTVKWVAGTSETYTTGTVITITIATSTAVAAPITVNASTTPSISLDQSGTNNTNFSSTSTSNGSEIITLTVATTTAATTTFAVPLSNFVFGTEAQNYTVSVFVSNANDFGAALFYANGGNQVNVTASVPATLSFALRNDADTANTNSCALGTLSTGATSTCAYRLRVSTNAASGFTATVQANHDFGTGTATMTTVGDNDKTNTAGKEGYGIDTVVGASAGGRNVVTAAFDQPVTVSGAAGTTFNSEISPVPTSTAVTMISYTGSFSASPAASLTTTSEVTHFANINGGTPAGDYSQTVTYLVTATF